MSTDNIFQVLFALLGKVLIAGGGGAVVAYGLFQLFGRNWINQYFDKQLQQFKHDQQIELERLRHEINSLFSRISKIHEKEFDVLPKAWELLHEANGAVLQLVKAFRRVSSPNGMSEPQLEEFLAAGRLTESQKTELRHARDKDKYYQDATFWLELSDAKRAQVALNNYLVVNSIFMTETLRQQFKTINGSLGSVIAGEEISREIGSGSAELAKSRSESLNQISSMFNEIESAVQKRLRYEEV
jgi:hypothetical protein